MLGNEKIQLVIQKLALGDEKLTVELRNQSEYGRLSVKNPG
jgi:hypothetical protein